MCNGVKTVAHITAAYMGKMSSITEKKTAATKLLKEVGQTDTFDVTAIVVTKRTVSARVKLSESAMRIYQNDGDDPHIGRPGSNDSHLYNNYNTYCAA